MASRINNTIRIQAEDMYIVDSLSCPQIAEKTGLKLSTLYKWCKFDDWNLKRIEYKKQLGDIRKNIRRLRYELSKKAVKTLDSQDIYAFERMERLSRQFNDDVEDVTQEDESQTHVSLKDAAIKALKRLSNNKNLKVNEIKDALLIAEKLEQKNIQTEKNEKIKKAPDQSALEEIKKKFLGI